MRLNDDVLTALRGLSTPTVSNAIEAFNVRRRNEGFMSPQVRSLFPDQGVMVGYAVTARFAALHPPGRHPERPEFWNHILSLPEPRVVVMEDVDDTPGVGAYFGEVQTNIHLRLGCIGVVTNGHVRDLDEVRPLGFQYFAGGVCVSHAYVHLVEVGRPVSVGGVVVHPGDLIHADKHGVLTVPLDIAPEVPKAAAEQAKAEAKIIACCKAPDFSVEKLSAIYK